MTNLGLFALTALLGACSSQPEPAGDANATDEVVAAADAFCPQGFAYDAGNQLCLNATDAAGPFPPSMIAFCKQWVPDRADGSNSCQTNEWGFPATRWDRQMAIDARAATTPLGQPCPQGTTFDAGQGYCSDGTNLYGPFSKDDVFFCQTERDGGPACETNRIAVGAARPKTPGPGPGGNPIASFAGSYNRTRAVDYAQANWNNNDGELCQGFVSNALSSGGIDVRSFGVPNDDWVPDVYQFVWDAKGVPFDEHAPGSTAPVRACPGDVVVYSNATGSNFCRPDLNGNEFIRNCGHTGLVVRGGKSVGEILANHHNGSNQNTALNRILDGTQLGLTARNYSTLRVYHLSNCESYPSAGPGPGPGPTPNPGGFNATNEIAVSGASWGKLVIAVGHAEGTLTATGGKTDAYFGHGDSGLHNIGLWSCTVCGDRSGPQADQYYYDSNIAPEVGRYAQAAGAYANHPMVAAAFFGLLVQSPLAALEDEGDDLAFINLLARGQLSGPVTEAKLLDLLVRAWTVNGVMKWKNPDTGLFDGVRGRQDQLRRLQAYASSLSAQGVNPYP